MERPVKRRPHVIAAPALAAQPGLPVLPRPFAATPDTLHDHSSYAIKSVIILPTRPQQNLLSLHIPTTPLVWVMFRVAAGDARTVFARALLGTVTTTQQ